MVVGPNEALLSTWTGSRSDSHPLSQFSSRHWTFHASIHPDIPSIFSESYFPQAIDKRNQNIIRSILESPPPANVSHAEEKVGGLDGCLHYCQARTFYQSCVRERETTAPEDLLNLQAVLEFAGGWELSGSQNASMLLSERIFRLQNQLGLSPKPLLPSFQECRPSSRGG